MNSILEKLEDNDFADQLGKQLAKEYGIRKVRSTGRYNTPYGDKTAQGLARIMVRSILEFKKEKI